MRGAHRRHKAVSSARQLPVHAALNAYPSTLLCIQNIIAQLLRYFKYRKRKNTKKVIEDGVLHFRKCKINKRKGDKAFNFEKDYKIDKILANPLYIRKNCGIIIVGVEGFHTKIG